MRDAACIKRRVGCYENRPFLPPPLFKRAFRRFAFASNTRAHRSLSVVSIHTARCARWRPLRLPSRLC